MDKHKFLNDVTDIWDMYLPYNMPDAVLSRMSTFYEQIHDEGYDEGYQNGIQEGYDEAAYDAEPADCPNCN